MFPMRYILLSLLSLAASPVFSDMPEHHQPSGLDTTARLSQEPTTDVVVRGIMLEAEPETSPEMTMPIAVVAKEDTAKEEEEPVIQPLILAGSGAIAVGTGLGIAGVLGAPVLIVIALLFFAAGAWLTAIGWRKLKDAPKKYKGEKIAVINYLVMGVLGVVASFYSLYILFSV